MTGNSRLDGRISRGSPSTRKPRLHLARLRPTTEVPWDAENASEGSPAVAATFRLARHRLLGVSGGAAAAASNPTPPAALPTVARHDCPIVTTLWPLVSRGEAVSVGPSAARSCGGAPPPFPGKRTGIGGET